MEFFVKKLNQIFTLSQELWLGSQKLSLQGFLNGKSTFLIFLRKGLTWLSIDTVNLTLNYEPKSEQKNWRKKNKQWNENVIVTGIMFLDGKIFQKDVDVS